MSPYRRTRATLAALSALVTMSACLDDRPEALTSPGRTALRPAAADAIATAGLPTAAVSLSTASALLTQTGTTAWTLAKTGAVDAATKTVTWTITATKGTTIAGQLVVSGLLAVTNTGTAGATIGNIVVTLQQKTGTSWTSLSADVADATHGDAATSAHIDPKASSENLATITENTASGSLQFLDANSNTLFALTPEQTIAPNATVTLLFSARFDNTVLELPVGQAVRAEVIVSFGRSTATKPSAQNVDINGNGVIDADEAWVRSVPARLGLTVPAQQTDNGTLTINDVASNITSTGTVTYSNPTFTIGATSGTVTVNYDGGASGGKITNCATGTGSGTTVVVGGFTFPVDGSVGIQACNTQDIGASQTCTEGAAGCGWNSGDLTTYDQLGWDPNPGSILTNNFSNVYGGASLVIGGNFFLSFTSGSAVLTYIPAVGAAAPLTANMENPNDTSSGSFGGDVLTLQLDIDYSDAGKLSSSTSYKFGDLTLCGMTPSTLNNLSVRQFNTVVNALLGGGSSGGFTTADIGTLDPITADLAGAFQGGSPSTFAQQHLVHGACGWNSGDLTTYDQFGWDSDPGSILTNNFSSVYSGGSVIIGGAFELVFSDARAVLAYLPASGTARPLTATMQDPTDTASGVFGGDVLALQLDIDFSDAGKLPGNTSYKFGDLTLCNVTPTGLNNLTVRQYAVIANALLGGGSSGGFSGADITTLDPITADIAGAFEGGTPSNFAQQHLVHGTCP